MFETCFSLIFSDSNRSDFQLSRFGSTACRRIAVIDRNFEKEKAANLKVNIFFHFAKKLEHILLCTDYMHIDDTQLHLFCAHYVYLKLIV